MFNSEQADYILPILPSHWLGTKLFQKILQEGIYNVQ